MAVASLLADLTFWFPGDDLAVSGARLGDDLVEAGVKRVDDLVTTGRASTTIGSSAADVPSRAALLNKAAAEGSDAGASLGRTLKSSADEAGGGAAKSFDEARREAFSNAGMTNPSEVRFTQVDSKTGTVVEFKGPNGAKVGYDGPHSSPGPHHDTQHVSWQGGVSSQDP